MMGELVEQHVAPFISHAAAAACSKDTNCVGFNSNGWIKKTVSPTISSLGTCLYTKISGINWFRV